MSNPDKPNSHSLSAHAINQQKGIGVPKLPIVQPPSIPSFSESATRVKPIAVEPIYGGRGAVGGSEYTIYESNGHWYVEDGYTISKFATQQDAENFASHGEDIDDEMTDGGMLKYARTRYFRKEIGPNTIWVKDGENSIEFRDTNEQYVVRHKLSNLEEAKKTVRKLRWYSPSSGSHIMLDMGEKYAPNRYWILIKTDNGYRERPPGKPLFE